MSSYKRSDVFSFLCNFRFLNSSCCIFNPLVIPCAISIYICVNVFVVLKRILPFLLFSTIVQILSAKVKGMFLFPVVRMAR